MREVADQVGQRLAELDGVDLDELRGRLRHDVQMQVLAGGLVRQVDGIDELPHDLAGIHNRKV